MKKILIALNIAIWSFAYFGLAYAKDVEIPTKQVCKDQLDKNGKPVKAKDGSVKQVCKTIKIHKKHEGTKVPGK